MREDFPIKERGDPLSAEHVNMLSQVAGAFSRFRQGGYFGSWAASDGPDPGLEFVMQITNNIADDSDTADSGRYLGVARYFDSGDGLWKTDDYEYELDCRAYSVDTVSPQRAPVLLYGDRVRVRYDEQAGVLVPAMFLEFEKWVFTPTGGIAARDDKTVYSAECDVVDEVLNSTGDEIEWSYRLDGVGERVKLRVFNKYPDEVLEETHIKVSYDSIGQWHVSGHPCSADSELS